MQISGMQKLTLLDYPGKVACTLFTPGCNLRCPFCHNASLVLEPQRTERYESEEVLGYLRKRIGILEGVCITGGEPLLQPGIEDFIRQVKDMGYSVKLDTNGCYPQKLKSLVKEGLVDYVAMDIKNCKEKYGSSTGIHNLDLSPVEESVSFLLKNTVAYEFRTTVVSELHDVSDIQHIVEWIQGAPRYYLQNFVDSGELIKSGLNPVDSLVLEEMKQVAQRYIKHTELRGV